ncbi:hypothetical protein FA95DRAFT_1586566 [Auriscalpium vulgare]|uniref:Uncharacterized protein n=1 Tax=Auriscalpium vulgare TaxID=40419 RepID=A0ACB8S9T8_9AGAM|nr:hypothetical protein FA95DRAFT_1586566 [Auriscalpium vulgare]
MSAVTSSRSRSTLSELSTAPTSPEQGERNQNLTVPSVILDTPTISEEMAASLAISLLGHVLFLKSQVPFPVGQLARLPGGSSKSRAAKKRTDLINAFDELTSHLHTTFSSLATALARNKDRFPELNAEGLLKGTTYEVPVATAYLLFILGPTVGAPKARVIMAVEGLEVKIWGAGEHEVERTADGLDDSEEEESDEEVDDEDSEEEDNISEGGTEEDGASFPPSSPLPSEPATSRPPTPHSGSSASSSSGSQRLSRKASHAHGLSQPRLAPPRSQTHAEEQQALRAAERLLSRTLANAHAEGGGMACELAPTQMHVLLRAPRRFSHPAWLPRQSATSSLESILESFLHESGLQENAQGSRQRSRGVRTEGMLVGCRSRSSEKATAPTGVGDEADEMIWWGWNGRLCGFADW